MAVFGRKQAAVLAWRDSHVVIAKGTTSIADDAFRNIGQTITSVIIQEGVASIGDSVFVRNQLTNIVISSFQCH